MSNKLEILGVYEGIEGVEFTIYGDIENPLFLAKDVAEWIEYEKDQVGKMLSTVDEDEKVLLNTRNIITGKGNPNKWFLTEDGLYEVLMQSRKPVAKQFKKRVKQILKQIRKTGGYIPVKEEDDELTIMSKALLIAQKTLEQKDCLIEEQKKTIKMKAIDKPYTIDKVRGLFGMSRKEFETELYNRGWLKWTEDKQIQILESKYLMKSNKGKKGRPGIYLTEEGLEQITKGRIMK